MGRKTLVERYTFDTAEELLNWLKSFKEKDLSTVYLNNVTFSYEEERLSDGSFVNNIRIQD